VGVLARWFDAVPAASRATRPEPPGEDASFSLYIHSTSAARDAVAPAGETPAFQRPCYPSATCGAIGCHDRLGQQEGLVLTPGNAYGNTVGVPSHQMPSLLRVAPGDPSGSYLYRKVTGSGISGDRMPQGGPYLSDAQIKLVRDWIRRGAPND